MNLVIGYLLKSVLTKIVGSFLFVAFQIKEDSDFNPKYFKRDIGFMEKVIKVIFIFLKSSTHVTLMLLSPQAAQAHVSINS